MIAILMLIVGIILMIYSISLSIKLILLLSKELKPRVWTLFSLICFFLIGYIGYFYFFYNSLNEIDLKDILINSILFFGSVFVVLVLHNDLKIVKSLNSRTEKEKNLNKDLSDKTEELKKNKYELEKAKKELEKKNKELEAALEDFYMLRVQMSPNFEYGDIKKENEKIKERIEQLKRSKNQPYP